MPEAGYKKLSSEEIRLAKQWYAEDVAASDIAERLGRDKSTITRLVVQQVERRSLGRRASLTPAQVDFLARRLDELIRQPEALSRRSGDAEAQHTCEGK